MDLSEEAVNSLDRGVGKLAALGGAVKTPRFTNLCVHKVGDVLRVSKVHEGITNVQLCAEVDTQVAEVVVSERALVKPQGHQDLLHDDGVAKLRQEEVSASSGCAKHSKALDQAAESAALDKVGDVPRHG